MQKAVLSVHDSKLDVVEELIVNPSFLPNSTIGSFFLLHHVDNNIRALLRVSGLSSTRSPIQLSISRSISELFEFSHRQEVLFCEVQGCDYLLEYIELSFKDQYISRGDLYHFKECLQEQLTLVYIGKNLCVKGLRAQVVEMLINDEAVSCGVAGPETKLVFRSRSSKIFWLIQISKEMWNFSEDGELNFERAVSGLIRTLFEKWQSDNVDHSLTVVIFARTFFESNDNSFVSDSDDEYEDDIENDCMIAMNRDSSNRIYKDYYKIVVENYHRKDCSELVKLLKIEFSSFPVRVGWGRILAGTDLLGIPSSSVEGNFLEAINLSLSVFEKHYIDRDLLRSGQGILIITAGSGLFIVDRSLAELTRGRVFDNGIGVDIISVDRPPLHVTPLFILTPAVRYAIPLWLQLKYFSSCSFLPEKDTRDSFVPLPSNRMIRPSFEELITRMCVTNNTNALDEILSVSSCSNSCSSFALNENEPLIPYHPREFKTFDNIKSSMKDYDNKLFRSFNEMKDNMNGNANSLPLNTDYIAKSSIDDADTGTILGTSLDWTDSVSLQHMKKSNTLLKQKAKRPMMRRRRSTSVGQSPTNSFKRAFSIQVVHRIAEKYNPFRKLPESARVLVNKRRWSHLIPIITVVNNVMIIDWKSVTTPAILPLTTDYFPTQGQLHSNYYEYVHSVSLVDIQEGDLVARTEALLAELIAQRLAQDFQIAPSSAPGVFNLSLGTQFHQIHVDYETNSILVKRYLDKKSYITLQKYNYFLWSPLEHNWRVKSSHLSSHHENYNWNYVDQLFTGFHDELTMNVKYRRVRMVLIPTSDSSMTQIFSDFFEAVFRCTPGSKGVRISEEMHPKHLEECNLVIELHLPSDDRTEYLRVHFPSIFSPFACYPFEMGWLLASGLRVAEWVSNFCRKAKNRHLSLVQQYDSLPSNPFQSIISLRIPSCSPTLFDKELRNLGFFPNDNCFLHRSGVVVLYIKRDNLQWISSEKSIIGLFKQLKQLLASLNAATKAVLEITQKMCVSIC